MNGVSRFLSRRDKHHHEKRQAKLESKHARNKSHNVPNDLYTIISNEAARPEKDEDKKVKSLVQRLHSAGITTLQETHAQYALSKYPESLDKAFELLVLANDSFEGILKEYDPKVKMLGAVNRNMTTCYLDALLFAMFARLDSFEAMLFDHFNEDDPRKKLAGVLRFWVNLLRSGELINIELTKHLQNAIASCGWEDAAEVRQQDASEAFTFITDAMELPLLTLKMDIYHTGKEEEADDHKFVNERLLEVAIPEQEGDKAITLEDCLETYFNNKIEVKRFLQRQNTIGSVKVGEIRDIESKDFEKGGSIHIETVELPEASPSLVSTPTSFSPSTPVLPSRPTVNRRRADSIFSERYKLNANKSSPGKAFDEKRLLNEMLDSSSAGRPRSASLRKEVLMPAWQFFSLIPWYTDNVPKTDAQVAAHFSAKRPVLGICLKRYMMMPDGTPKRLNTFIDIPLEIGLPQFISDDRMEEEGPLFGNFKLVLQSVVCHRGVSLDSGHYISLVRANEPTSRHHQSISSSSSDTDQTSDSWLRFDDLAPDRVTSVDMQKALRDESPYLLFYQVQPINEELAARGDPPAYAEAQSVTLPEDPSRETLASVTSNTSASDAELGDWDRVTTTDITQLDSGSSGEPKPRMSTSSDRRSSATFEEVEGSATSQSRGHTAPPTPLNEEDKTFLSASRRGSYAWMPGNNKSRPSSQNGESRLSLTLSRLTGRASKEKLPVSEAGYEDPVIVINEVKSTETSGSSDKEKEQQEQDKPAESHSQGHLQGHVPATGNTSGIGRHKSKKDKGKEKKRGRSTSRQRGEKEGKGRPDRECVVM